MPETWRVGIVIPEAEFADFYKYAVGVFLTSGASAVPAPAKLVGDVAAALPKALFNGIPITGTLTIDENALLFKTSPNFVERFIVEGELTVDFSIPLRSVTSVKGPPSLVPGLLTGTLNARRIEIITTAATFYISAGIKSTFLTNRLLTITEKLS